MIALLLFLQWQQPTPVAVLEGTATYYADRHHLQGVALNRKGDLGREVWLEWPDGQIDGPLVATDCAQERHFIARGKKIVEVSASLARRRGFYGVGPKPVTVWLVDPTGFRRRM